MNFIVKTLKSIFKYLKLLLLNIIKFFYSLFKKNEKNKVKVESKTIINKNDSTKIKINITESLPDEESTKQIDSSSNQKPSAPKITINKKDVSLLKEISTPEELLEDEKLAIIIDEILEKEFKIELKKISKIMEYNLKEYKKDLIPRIKEKINNQPINNEELKNDVIKKEIENDIKKEKIILDIQKSTYIILFPLKRPLKISSNAKPKIKKDSHIKKVTSQNISKTKENLKKPFFVLPTYQKPKITPNTKIINKVSKASLIITSTINALLPEKKEKDQENKKQIKAIPKEPKKVPENKTSLKETIDQPKIKIKKELEKQNEQLKSELKKIEEKLTTLKKEQTTKTVPKESISLSQKEEIKIVTPSKPEHIDNHQSSTQQNNTQQSNHNIPNDDNLVTKTNISINLPLINIHEKDENEKKKEVEKDKQANEFQDNNKDKIKNEDTQTQIEKIDIILPATLNNIDEVISASQKEMASEKEIEDKKYNEFQKEINKLLYDIEMYKIKYEKVLTPSQKKKLRIEEKKLRNAKNNISKQRNIDIAKEKADLEQTISQNELEQLKLELQKRHIENQLEINEHLLNNIEEIEELSNEKIKSIEKKLIKRKLRKALIVSQMSSILALPFIRNKFFFFFTAGLFIKTEFMFLTDIFNRQKSNYIPPDFSELYNGQDALNSAINITYENLVYLEYLKNRALNNHPELINDYEFITYITNLENSLNKRYEKLLRKNKVISKIIKKSNKQVKKLQRVQEKNTQ